MTLDNIKNNKKPVLIGAILVLLLGIGLYFILHHNEETTDDAAIDGRIYVVSPKVNGYVKALHAEDNQIVKAGEILLEIDPTDYQIRRDRAQANLDAAKARYASSGHRLAGTRVTAPSEETSARAQVVAAQAEWERAHADADRMRALNQAARTRKQLEDAVAVEKAAASSLEDAKARLASAATAPNTVAAAEAEADELGAQVKFAQAELAQAQKDLNDTKILAPSDGRITKRGIEAGNYVTPGQQLMMVVGPSVWVTANFKETQLTEMRPGQRVDIEIDAFPGQHFSGKVESVQRGTGARFSAFPPENATGNFVKIVQRVPVKILFDRLPDAALAVGPGMSVIPTVHTN